MTSKTRHRTIWLLAIVLLVSTCATTIAFANIMGEYNMDDSGAIALINETDETEKAPSDSFTETEAETETEAVTETETETIIPETEIDTYDPEVPAPNARPGFEVYDDNTVWSTNTDIEIFRISYENGEQKITVNSSDGDKLIAPGTENSYVFKLKNTGNVPLKYSVQINAKIEPAGITIPVTARLSRHDGKWITGNGTNAYVNAPNLDLAEDEATIGVGKFTYYTLDWQWPFETGNDERDTLLGNMAVDEDLTFTIEIITHAEFDGVGEDIGILPPQTGDNSRLALWLTIAMSSLVIIVVLIIIDRRAKRTN